MGLAGGRTSREDVRGGRSGGDLNQDGSYHCRCCCCSSVTSSSPSGVYTSRLLYVRLQYSSDHVYTVSRSFLGQSWLPSYHFSSANHELFCIIVIEAQVSGQGETTHYTCREEGAFETVSGVKSKRNVKIEAKTSQRDVTKAETLPRGRMYYEVGQWLALPIRTR